MDKKAPEHTTTFADKTGRLERFRPEISPLLKLPQAPSYGGGKDWERRLILAIDSLIRSIRYRPGVIPKLADNAKKVGEEA